MRSQRGQAQLLMASVMGAVMLTGALFSLQLAEQTSVKVLKTTKRQEIRAALDLAARTLNYLYTSESACDPVILNRKIARMNSDGTVNPNPDITPTPSNPTTRRRLNITVGSNSYDVFVGALSTLSWDSSVDTSLADDSPGISQDVTVELWTYSGHNRYQQLATLINTCTLACSAGCHDSNDCAADTTNFYDTTRGTVVWPCIQSTDAAIAYHRILDPGDFPTSSTGISKGCYGSARYYGDLDTSDTSCTAVEDKELIDERDLVILRNYLRSGDVAGSCADVLQGATGKLSCADLNGDQLVNELDLSILEKTLRGYLYRIPVR